MIGMDPIKTRGASKVGLAEAGRTLRAIATSGRTLREGLADAAAVARSGRQALDQAEWALHLQVDGFDRAAADRQLEAARRICLQDGQEISPNVAIALNARPYSIRGMLGLQGERWVPIHGIFPLSQAAAAAARVQAFLDARTDLLERHGIGHCCCMFTEGPAFAIEPMFYWRDEIGPLHRRHLDARNYARFKDAAPEPDVRAAVRGLRDELKGLFFELGAVHGQIGKFYDFAGAVEPGLFDLLTRLKRALDPDGRLNPGNFGWSAAETRP
jgi:D-lactate dehydrogenase (cytochrome)